MILPSGKIGNLLVFKELETFHDLRWVFAIAWRFTDLGGEAWTHRMSEFKNGSPSAIRGAIRVVSLALKGIDWRGRKIGLTAAISSKRRSLRPDCPLALLGEGVAAQTGLPWLPKILKKKVRRYLHGFGNAERRPEEVNGKYRCLAVDGLTTLIVLDDFVTRGDTMSDIARAIRASNDQIQVFGLALGKSETWGYANLRGHSLNNHDIPDAWGRVWDSA